MICVVCSDSERTVEPGWLTCYRCWSRLANALRQIPGLVAELVSLGLVQREHRGERRDLNTGRTWPHFDPIAHALTAGPINGAKSAPRVSGSRAAPVPIRLDPTDLTASVRPASTAVHARSPWPADQIGWLSVATELDFWAADWAAERRESRPIPQVPVLCGWLLDRLDWACTEHVALDEFAVKVSAIYGALMSAVGGWTAKPETLITPCKHCGILALYREIGPAPEYDRVACGACPALLTEVEYAQYVRELVDQERRRKGSPMGGLVHEANGLRVYLTDAGDYVMADGGGWLPGAYPSIEAAMAEYKAMEAKENAA